jgi:nitrogen fixation NifU-like protein
MTMSNLDDLYREIILDHYRTPRNRGEIEHPSVRVEGHNPLCGDEITLYLNIDDGVVTDVKLAGHGCSISQASSSMMTAAIKGKTVEQIRATIETVKSMLTDGSEIEVNPRQLGELAALSGVSKFPVRIKCATLAWNTLAQALDEASA